MISAITTAWILAIVNVLGLILINFFKKKVAITLNVLLIVFNLVMILLILLAS